MRYALAAALLVACSASPALSPRDCTPGATLACACPGASGVQTCEASGTLGACVCADGGAGDAPPEDRPALDAVAGDAPASRADALPVPDVAPDAPTPAVDAGSPQDAPVARDVVCGRGEVVCGGGSALSPTVCAILAEDPLNCGRCGRQCAPIGTDNTVPYCGGGACLLECAVNFTDCDGDPGNGCETDMRRPGFSCSRCGNRCPRRLTCDLGGRCVSSEG